MKLTTLLILIGFLHVSASSFAQRISFSAKNISMVKFLKEIRKETGYTFVYRSGTLDDLPNMDVDITNASLQDILDNYVKDKPLDYVILDKTVVIRRKAEPLVKEIAGPRIFYGKVFGENKKPLPGVTIKVKGTQTGSTSTNDKGEYSILAVPDNATLVFSSVGYVTQEIVTGGIKNELNVILKQSNSALDQVQVTAYGTTTKRLSTGNITTITAKEIAENPVPNVLQALQGRVPGLFIVQNSGQAASPYSVNIRGQNSLQGVIYGSKSDPQPLLIVDGVQYPSGTLPLSQFQGVNESTFGSNPLNYIDPQTIESVDVLKDADATAIYGSKGAYGVIIITTKKGKAGDATLTLNNYTGVSVRGTTPKLLSLQQYLDMRREAFKNDNATPGAADLDLNGTWPLTRNTDFQHVLMGSRAITSSSNASYSGGTDNLRFLIGANYDVQNNIQRSTGDNKSEGLNFNLTSTSKNKKFSITLVDAYSSTIDTEAPVDFSFLAGPGSATSAPNAPSLTNSDGSLNWADYPANPLAQLNQSYRNVTNNLTSSTQLRYAPVKGLTLNASFNYNKLFGKETRILPSDYFNPNTTFFTSSNLNNYDQSTWTFEPNANYITKLGSKGKLSVSAGATLQGISISSATISGDDFISDALLSDPASTNQDGLGAGFSLTQRRYLGYFGIINYNWADKYIIDLNGRRDGSSKFGTNNQFGSFGSVGAAWLLSEEKWFKNNISFINFAKIRGSYGLVGGDGIPDYATLNNYGIKNSYESNLGIGPLGVANPNLQWEKDLKKEIGLTLELLNGRITFDGDYYFTRVSNQLLPDPLSTVTGFSNTVVNRDAVINSYGWEFTITSHNVKTNNFSWSTSINGTIPKSILISFPGLATSGLENSLQIGKSVNGIALINSKGVDPQTGLYNYMTSAGTVVDNVPTFLGGKGQLSLTTDRTSFLDLNPKFYGGISNTFSYKSFSLDVLINITDRMGRNSLGQGSFPPGFFNGTGYDPTTAVLSRWQKPGDITNVAKYTQSVAGYLNYSYFDLSTGAYSNATYARLQNANFSYTFPTSVATKAGLKTLRIFVQGQNLLTISKYGSLDPENLGAGMAPLRTITGGVNVSL